MLNKIILVILISSSLLGCKSKKDEESIMVPAITSYQKGLEAFKKDKFADAADEFGKVYFQHPGAEITPYAELLEAYSLYQARQYSDSIDVLENFILIHPSHEDISYAYYLKSLTYYMQISDIHHDQEITEKTKAALEETIARFSGTKYALDAAMKLDLVNDHLAGKEMEIGRYYQKRLNPIGAINRFQSILEQYQTTSHAAEALYRLVESFEILGLRNESNKYASVLIHNYPESSWAYYAKQLIQNK